MSKISKDEFNEIAMESLNDGDQERWEKKELGNSAEHARQVGRLQDLMRSGPSVPLSAVKDVFEDILCAEFWLSDQPDLKFRFVVAEHMTFDLDSRFANAQSTQDLEVMNENFTAWVSAHVTSISFQSMRFFVEELTISTKSQNVSTSTKISGIFHRSIRPIYSFVPFFEAKKNNAFGIHKGIQICLDSINVNVLSSEVKSPEKLGVKWQIDMIWQEGGTDDLNPTMYDYYGATTLTEGSFRDPYNFSCHISESGTQVTISNLRRFSSSIRSPLPNSYSEQLDFAEFHGSSLCWLGGEIWQGYERRRKSDQPTVDVITEMFPHLLSAPWGVKGQFANAILEAMASRLTEKSYSEVTPAHQIVADLIGDFQKANGKHPEMNRLAAIKSSLLQPKQRSRRSRINEMLTKVLDITLSSSERKIIDKYSNVYAHEIIDDSIHSATNEDVELAFEYEAVVVSVATKSVLAFFGYRKPFYRQKYPSGGDLYRFDGTP